MNPWPSSPLCDAAIILSLHVTALWRTRRLTNGHCLQWVEADDAAQAPPRLSANGNVVIYRRMVNTVNANQIIPHVRS